MLQVSKSPPSQNKDKSKMVAGKKETACFQILAQSTSQLCPDLGCQVNDLRGAQRRLRRAKALYAELELLITEDLASDDQFFDQYMRYPGQRIEELKTAIESLREEASKRRREEAELDNQETIASRVSAWRTPSARIPSGTYRNVPWVGYAELQSLLERFHQETTSPSDWQPPSVAIPGVFLDTIGIRPVRTTVSNWRPPGQGLP